MKVILLPLFKFLWAIILTLVCLFTHSLIVIATIVYILWEGKIIKKNIELIWEYKMSWIRNDINFSPYTKDRIPKWG